MLSDSEGEEEESLPSSASEPDEASDSEDDFSPEKKPKAAAPTKKHVPSSCNLLCSFESEDTCWCPVCLIVDTHN